MIKFILIILLGLIVLFWNDKKFIYDKTLSVSPLLIKEEKTSRDVGMVVGTMERLEAKEEEIVISKKVKASDLKDWENFTPEQLKIIQKELDEGHWPWRLDPRYVAGVFLLHYYNLTGDIRELAEKPIKVKVKGDKAIVIIKFKEKIHKIYLERPLKSSETIWVAKEMEIAEYLNKKGSIK